ncbi:unnamed protein product [Amoebophrya sp. A120]|nr:unnamed protein product [Amoebophrya sp. A120]|eukprot:GSA120T00020103001.1
MDDAHVAGWMRDAIKTESSFNYSFVKYLAYGYGTADKGPKDTPKLLTDLTTFVKNLPDLLPPGVPVPKALADFATFLQNLDPTVFTNFLSDSGANMFSVSVAQVVLMFVLALALQLAKCTPMLRKGSIVKRKGLLVFLVISLAMLFTAWVLHMLRWARVAQLFYAENDNVWYGIQANAPAPVYPADGSPPIIDFPDYFFFYRAVAGFLYASLLTKYGNIPTKEDIQQFASGDIDGDFNFQLGSGALWLCEMWMPILTITGFILLILGYCKLPTEMNAVAEIRNKDLDSEDEHLP